MYTYASQPEFCRCGTHRAIEEHRSFEVPAGQRVMSSANQTRQESQRTNLIATV